MTNKKREQRAARKNRDLSGSAVTRYRRFPAHDRAALRRPRKVHSRARRGDEG